MPKPASVVVPNCSNSVLRACSGWKSQEGRTVIAAAGWPRSMPDPRGIEAQLGDQDLGRVEPGDLVDQLGPQQAGQREPARRELDPGQAELAADLDDRRQVIGRLGVEQLVVGQGARA